ncbi:MAG: nucleotidyltransferase family protein [Phycisphaerae bacterium]|nr:nucleotidyltransferase family protein [Phycisphaerae bacterium]
MAIVDDKLTVCILAGGLSRRLRPMTQTTPKPMIPVGGKPFLQIQMEHFASLGYRRFVLAVSYLWQQIRDYFGNGEKFGWRIEYSLEPQPLGTGGAVLYAQPMWGHRALVANGDTFLPEDWRELVAEHKSAGTAATLALVHQENCARFGKVAIRDGRVVGFEEKNPNTGAGWINAGVYVLQREVFSAFRRGQAFSLERDVFPPLSGRIAAYTCKESFADIGTPESLAAFRQQCEQVANGRPAL